MNWEMFYLTCFLVGVTLSLIAFVGGSLHLPHVHFHLSHGHAAPGIEGGHAGVGRGPEMPVFNFATITAFLAWFGGTGYLLTRHSSMLVVAVILLAIAAGVSGAAIVFWFIVKFLLTHDQALDPADYEAKLFFPRKEPVKLAALAAKMVQRLRVAPKLSLPAMSMALRMSGDGKSWPIAMCLIGLN
jgi:hypothetical protein